MPTDVTSSVTAWYQAVQFRDPSQSDLLKYITALQFGTMTPAQVQTAIETDAFTTNFVNPIIREYQAAFGRVPDQAGLAYWVGVVAKDPNALSTLATNFAGSAEFKSAFGNKSPDQPVDFTLAFKLYTNVLGRVPDQAGLDYWVKSGASASQLLNAFAQSPEYTNSTNDKIKIFLDLELAGSPATSGSLLQVQPAQQAPTPISPTLAFKDGSNAVTFDHPGTTISMQLSGGTYSFSSNGIQSSIPGPVASINVPTGSTLSVSSADVGGITFPNAGTIALKDAVTASALNTVVFGDDTTLTLANVTGNSLTLVDATTSSGKTLTIDGSAVTSAITINGAAETNGTLILKGGAGADTISGGARADTLTGGAGIDNFVYTAANRSTLATIDSITDYRAAGGSNAGALDTITINDFVTVASNVSTVQDLSAQASLSAALNVFANAATTSNGLGVFIWGGNTYAYVETTGSSTAYVAGDTVIKLVGTPFAAGTSIVGLGIDGV